MAQSHTGIGANIYPIIGKLVVVDPCRSSVCIYSRGWLVYRTFPAFMMDFGDLRQF